MQLFLKGARAFPPSFTPLGGLLPPTLFRLVARFARVRIGDSSQNRFASTAYFAQSQTTLFPCILFMGGKLGGLLCRSEIINRSSWGDCYVGVIESCMFLGVYIDDGFTFKSDINFIVRKFLRSAGILYRTKSPLLLEGSRLKYYYSFIYPYVSYTLREIPVRDDDSRPNGK